LSQNAVANGLDAAGDPLEPPQDAIASASTRNRDAPPTRTTVITGLLIAFPQRPLPPMSIRTIDRDCHFFFCRRVVMS
jgi:hypothetical protein